MTKKENFDSITSFFKISGYNHRVFDLSRRVYPLSNKQFEKAEQQNTQYPTPFKQSAWLGLLFWHPKRPEEPVIWFLKFPIDELGYIDIQARDGFLNQVLNQLGENLVSQQKGNELSDTLKESPYAFKPQQEKMAIFHAIATQVLNLPASHYFQPTLDYLSGSIGYDQWNFLGLQGIADLAARLNQSNHEAVLTKAFPHIPDSPLITFCHMLEHTQPGQKLSQAIADKIDLISTSDDQLQTAQALLPALSRAISNSSNIEIRKQAYLKLLEGDHNHLVEVLAAITGRGWEALKDPTLMHTFIETLSAQDQAIFNALLDELMLMENMRDVIMGEFRSEKRSERVSEKIAGFMSRFRH